MIDFRVCYYRVLVSETLCIYIDRNCERNQNYMKEKMRKTTHKNNLIQPTYDPYVYKGENSKSCQREGTVEKRI